MEKPAFQIGRVVESRAGRDKGRLLVVIAVLDDDYVHIADGDLRKVASPKRKKRKHLRPKPQLFEDLEVKLSGNRAILDAEIRARLAGIQKGI
ncbi:MAG: RNA-binding protein [Christensenellales bacterium]|jgi:large subunit ribosomal protein L14e